MVALCSRLGAIAILFRVWRAGCVRRLDPQLPTSRAPATAAGVPAPPRAHQRSARGPVPRACAPARDELLGTVVTALYPRRTWSAGMLGRRSWALLVLLLLAGAKEGS